MMNAREWADKPKGRDSSYSITWYPSLIEMFATSDLGYATGPFDNVSTIPGDSSANHGQFVTVWKKQTDGSLKFIMDFCSGPLSRTAFVKKEPVFEPASTGQKKYKKVNTNKILNQLLALEKEFDIKCEINGDLKAYENLPTTIFVFFTKHSFIQEC